MTVRQPVLLTFNDSNPIVPEMTRMLRGQGCSVHHLQLSGHQPVLQEPGYRQSVVERVQETIRRLSAEVYIPLFEEAFFLAPYRDRLGCRTLMCPPEVYRDLHSKRRAARFCQRHDLPHLPTLVVEPTTTPGDIEAFAAGVRPLFLKGDDTRGGHGIRPFGSVEALVGELAKGDPERFLIQTCVPGHLWVVQGVFVEGELVDYEILRKLPCWDDRGTVRMLPFHRVESNERALDLLRRVGRSTGYQGMLEFECLGAGDDLQIMEFNPRFSGDFLHSPRTGSSFCVNTYRAYAGLEPVPRRSFEGSVTKNRWTLRRSLGRQARVRLLPLLDPRWPFRWYLAEARAAWTMLRHPYRSFSPRPDSLASWRRWP